MAWLRSADSESARRRSAAARKVFPSAFSGSRERTSFARSRTASRSSASDATEGARAEGRCYNGAEILGRWKLVI